MKVQIKLDEREEKVIEDFYELMNDICNIKNWGKCDECPFTHFCTGNEQVEYFMNVINNFEGEE